MELVTVTKYYIQSDFIYDYTIYDIYNFIYDLHIDMTSTISSTHDMHDIYGYTQHDIYKLHY
jgi:hypothetical protein